MFHEIDACSADVLAVDAGDAEFSRDPEPTGSLRRMTGSPSRPVRSGCPEQAANLEAYRLREMAGVLIEIADRYLDASVVLLTPLYIRVVRRHGLDPTLLAFQPVLLAALASSA